MEISVSQCRAALEWAETTGVIIPPCWAKTFITMRAEGKSWADIRKELPAELARRVVHNTAYNLQHRFLEWIYRGAPLSDHGRARWLPKKDRITRGKNRVGALRISSAEWRHRVTKIGENLLQVLKTSIHRTDTHRRHVEWVQTAMRTSSLEEFSRITGRDFKVNRNYLRNLEKRYGRFNRKQWYLENPQMLADALAESEQ